MSDRRTAGEIDAATATEIGILELAAPPPEDPLQHEPLQHGAP
jgi:hypothetical protein